MKLLAPSAKSHAESKPTKERECGSGYNLKFGLIPSSNRGLEGQDYPGR